MLRKKHVLSWLLAALAVAAGIGAALWQEGRALQAASNTSLKRVPSSFWTQSWRSPNGEQILAKAFQGKPLLLNFWATWCAPCIEEMPLLDGFYRQHAANGFQLLAIAADKAPQVNKFLRAHPVVFQIGLADFEAIALSQTLGNDTGGLPYSVLIDKNGAILFTKKGQLTTNDLDALVRLIQ